MLRLIDELEQIVHDSKMHVFDKVLIDENAFYLQISKLKKALPQDIQKAERLTRDTDRVLSGAQSEAHRLVTDAQSEAQRVEGEARARAQRVENDARQHSDRIIEDARREAERIIADAQQHAEQLISEHTISQRAQQAAEATHQAALRDAQDMRVQADNYAYEVLEKAGLALQRLLNGVEQGKDQIRQMQQQ